MSGRGAPIPLQYCSVCGERSSLRCSKCLGALYCSVSCQKRDWKTHKVNCKEAENVKKQYEERGYRTAEEVDTKLVENRRLAEMGLAFAQHNVGLAYSNGLGVAVDKDEGVRWLKKSAAQGFANAQCSLGHAYSHGFKWTKRAAEQGNVNAQCNLGYSYYHGKGVSSDKVESVKWFRKSAEQGDPNSQNQLGNAYCRGDGVGVDIVEGFKWQKRSAEQGYAIAQSNLGVAYFHGRGVSVDKVEAVRWYRLAMEQGDAKAQFNLGVAYLHGLGVAVDKVEGMKLVKLAAKNGFIGAIIYLSGLPPGS